MLDKIKGWLHHMFMAKPEVKEVTPEPKKEAVVKKKPVVKKTVRTRTVKGRYVADDLTTEDYNEAWVGGKAPMKNKPTITRKKAK
tara:strand:+ start:291 stop:545 length:255 start_codon:yes stop_codon:yes gene_type:complete